jgi:hypothetical protein
MIHLSHINLQSYQEYVDWYIAMQDKQKQFGLPIISSDFFDVHRPEPAKQAEPKPIPQPRVSAAWSSAATLRK